MTKIIITTIALIFLAGCASHTQQPEYRPYTENQYEAWRTCRVDYLNEHKIIGKPPTPVDAFFFGQTIDMDNDLKLHGPAMDKAVDACMRGKGYKRS